MIEIENYVPGEHLRRTVHGLLKMKCLTLRGWAASNGYTTSRVRSALLGGSQSRDSKRIIGEIIRDCGRENVEREYKRLVIEEADRLKSVA